ERRRQSSLEDRRNERILDELAAGRELGEPIADIVAVHAVPELMGVEQIESVKDVKPRLRALLPDPQRHDAVEHAKRERCQQAYRQEENEPEVEDIVRYGPSRVERPDHVANENQPGHGERS